MMDPLSELAALEAADSFVSRHVAPSEAEIGEMLAVVGASSLDDLAGAHRAARDPHPIADGPAARDRRGRGHRRTARRWRRATW